MKSFPLDSQGAGDVITPFAFNNEVGDLFKTIHALDWWNFIATSVTVDKLEAGACGDMRVTGGITGQVSTVTASANSNDVYPILTDAGVPWIERFTSGDGFLNLLLFCNLFNSNPSIIMPGWIGIRLDGLLVAQSGLYPAFTGAIDVPLQCGCMAPVGAGVHVIEPVFGVDTSFAAWAATDVEFDNRQLAIREFAR